MNLESLIHGGGQEQGFRAGTENAAFAVALGKAAELAHGHIPLYFSQVRLLRDRLHEALLATLPDAIFNGHSAERLPNTLNMSFPSVDARELQLMIGERVACSTGCSCHAGRTAPSAILLAVGRDQRIAAAALRLSLGLETTAAEIDEAAAVITSAVKQLRENPGWASVGNAAAASEVA